MTIRILFIMSLLIFACNLDDEFDCKESSLINPSFAIKNKLLKKCCKWVVEDVPIIMCDKNEFFGFKSQVHYQFNSYDNSLPTFKFWNIEVEDTLYFLKYLETIDATLKDSNFIWDAYTDFEYEIIDNNGESYYLRIDKRKKDKLLSKDFFILISYKYSTH